MKTTANYGLKKPEGNDTVNIDDLNYNADVVDQKIKAVETDITNLKTHVDNGKSSLYSAIVGKKVTPRSKDFDDLKNAINSIKLGQGNAQASEVLQGRTFTNDTGIMQTGAMPNMGSKTIEPKTYIQKLGGGYYSEIKFKELTTSNVTQLFTADKDKKEIINNITIPKTLEIIKNIYDDDDSKKEEIQEGLSKNFACGKAETKKMSFEFNEEQLKKMNRYNSGSLSQGFEIKFDTSMYKNAIYISAKGSASYEFDLHVHYILNKKIEELFNMTYKDYGRNDKSFDRKSLRNSFWECSLFKDMLKLYSGDKQYCDMKHVKFDLEIFGF